MFNRFTGILLTGIVIKLMDDFLDYNIDEWNSTVYLERAVLPYSLVLFFIALFFNFEESVGLFAASYCLGMNTNKKTRLPSGLLAWQEGLLIIIISICITDLYNVIYSLILILTIQLIDDLIDYQTDRYKNQGNYVLKFGRINIILVIIILVLISLCYFTIKFITVFTAVLIIYLLINILKKWME
ncbi:MAG: hypothetical protein ACOCQN_01030 [Halanaerobiaceae bacterium]